MKIRQGYGRTCRFIVGMAIVLAGVWTMILRLTLGGEAVTPVPLLAGIVCIGTVTGLGGLLSAAGRRHGRNMRRVSDVHA